MQKKGGMALVNVHPDYMNFEDRKCEREEYPAKFYVDFLEYVKNKYKDQYWNALPHQIASFCKKFVSNKNLKKNEEC